MPENVKVEDPKTEPQAPETPPAEPAVTPMGVEQLTPAAPEPSAETPTATAEKTIDVDSIFVELTGNPNPEKAKEIVENREKLIGTQATELGELRGQVKTLTDQMTNILAGVNNAGSAPPPEPEVNATDLLADFNSDPAGFLARRDTKMREQILADVGGVVERAVAPIAHVSNTANQQQYEQQMRASYRGTWDSLAPVRQALFQKAQSGQIGGQELYHKAALYDGLHAKLSSGEYRLHKTGTAQTPVTGGVPSSAGAPVQVEQPPMTEADAAAALNKHWENIDDGMPVVT